MFILGKQTKMGGALTCSQNPVLHPDYPSAVFEAERLSRENVGHKFVVFQAVAVSEAQPIPVKTVAFVCGVK